MQELFHPEQVRVMRIICECAEATSQRVYLVGGMVRDLLLGQMLADYDIDVIVENNAALLAQAFARRCRGTVKTYSTFLTAKVIELKDFLAVREVDFASSRTEEYGFPGALPTVSRSDLSHDLGRRDFSINALALHLEDVVALFEHAETLQSLRGQVIDQFAGLDDLDNRLIRVLHDQSFVDDPTRIFRALRYEGRLGGRIDSHTEMLLRAALSKGVLKTVSSFRLYSEVRKIFSELSALSILSRFEELNTQKSLENALQVPLDWLPGCVTRVDACRRKLPPRSRMELCDRLFYFATAEDVRRTFFQKLGWSKKRQVRLDQRMVNYQQGKLDEIETPTLLALWGLAENSELSEDQLSRMLMKRGDTRCS